MKSYCPFLTISLDVLQAKKNFYCQFASHLFNRMTSRFVTHLEKFICASGLLSRWPRSLWVEAAIALSAIVREEASSGVCLKWAN